MPILQQFNYWWLIQIPPDQVGNHPAHKPLVFQIFCFSELGHVYDKFIVVAIKKPRNNADVFFDVGEEEDLEVT